MEVISRTGPICNVNAWCCCWMLSSRDFPLASCCSNWRIQRKLKLWAHRAAPNSCWLPGSSPQPIRRQIFVGRVSLFSIIRSSRKQIRVRFKDEIESEPRMVRSGEIWRVDHSFWQRHCHLPCYICCLHLSPSTPHFIAWVPELQLCTRFSARPPL